LKYKSISHESQHEDHMEEIIHRNIKRFSHSKQPKKDAKCIDNNFHLTLSLS